MNRPFLADSSRFLSTFCSYVRPISIWAITCLISETVWGHYYSTAPPPPHHSPTKENAHDLSLGPSKFHIPRKIRNSVRKGLQRVSISCYEAAVFQRQSSRSANWALQDSCLLRSASSAFPRILQTPYILTHFFNYLKSIPIFCN